MESQQENLSPPPDRPSFFGLPANFYLWTHLGAKFWGGLMAGLGIGLLVARTLEDFEVPRAGWLRAIAILLGIGGPLIALRAARRNAQPDKSKPRNP
jgi:hypothetical protein